MSPDTSTTLAAENSETQPQEVAGKKAQLIKRPLPKQLTLELLRRLTYRSLPDWLRNNDCLRGSHRAQLPSFRHSLRSMFALHTETVNIWSHLVSLAFYLTICVMTFGLKYDPIASVEIHKLPWQDQVVIFLFFLGAFAAFSCSFLYHLLCAHSEEVCNYFAKLDYFGIILLVVTQSIGLYHFGFYFSLGTKSVYTSVYIIIVCLSFVMILSERFNTPALLALRVGVFFSLCLWNIIPVIHLCLLNGLWTVFVSWHILSIAIVPACGTVIYMTRFPESVAPGRFDVWGSSHQLWHIAAAIEPAVYFYCFVQNTILYHLSEIYP